MNLEAIKQKVVHIIAQKSAVSEKRQAVCDLLRSEIAHYDWVGFYFHNDNEELILHEFSGTATEHTKIPFGKGICGQVALSDENFVVQDVSEQDNYISCGLEVKSELVVPIFKNGKNIGQIDIDSHQLAPFTKTDEQFLEFINTLL
jgi:GAF domain-containing protein